ncbi:TPA: MptD family putative ECF transporter S component [Streptococcus equi subsp. zooepidemicus]|uniref:MptD family putative ECF transporter S component n=1 Tax=Streptococcus equi TaxID=1336 RepID=UPI0013F5B7EC|nr:MptD family putative ECF transporter S component [Streptococcus equi]HEL0614618.1 MptD family putative ECF transporter S component [Streptococcus equi subsp. zooepidemicus]HEL1229783.1 MptD family putative ECF transporter S component [Streptococcus equi subsp. zooepidemicus]
MDNKLRIKDLVLVAAFSVLGIAFMYLIPMPFLFTPYTILISPIVQSLFLALPFILTGAKVQKKWAILIYCVIWGLGGIMPYYIGMMVVAGIIAEFILAKTKNRFKGLSLSFVVAMLSHYIGGTVIPYIITKEQQLEMIKQMYGQDYAMKMQELKTIPTMIIIAVAVIVVSIIGTYISKKFCKKHF